MLLWVIFVLAVCYPVAVFNDFLSFKNANAESHEVLEKRFTWLSSMDLGYGAKRDTTNVDTTSTADLVKALNTISEDLTCSYMFSAQLHMHLTKMFIAYPSNFYELKEAEVDNLVFTEEAATMLAVVYDYGKQMDDNRTRLMLIFHMYTERVAEFLVKVYRDGYSKQIYEGTMINIHSAVEEMLGDFIATNECKTYASLTDNTISIWSAKKVLETILKGLSATRKAIVENKIRFWQQTNYNADRNLIAKNQDRFVGDRLLINRLLDSRQTIENLKTAFGVQLDWDFIVGSLESSYNLAKIDNNMLHESIDALTTFHSDFLDLLKAIAIRLVIQHLLYVKETLTSMPFYSRGVFLLYYCGSYNSKVADHLTVFAVHLDLIDDRQLRPAMDLMRSFLGNFITVNQIDGHVNDLFESLKEIPSVKSKDFIFNGTMTVDERSNNRLVEAVIEVLEKYNLEVSRQVDFCPLQKSVLIIEAFEKFVEEITKTVDFKMVKLFGKINKSTEYDRLKELETLHSNNTKNKLN